MRTIQNQILYISVKKSSNSIYQILIHGSENHPAVHTHADTHRKFINSSNTTCFFFQGANICLVVIFIKRKREIQKIYNVSLKEPEGKRWKKIWVPLYLTVVFSGQPRFSASHALITLPSVKIAPKEGVGSKLEWHTFSLHETDWYNTVCMWREPSVVMMLNVPIHFTCCRHDCEGFFWGGGVFFIKPSVTLQNYHYTVHKDTSYSEMFNLCKNLLCCL